MSGLVAIKVCLDTLKSCRSGSYRCHRPDRQSQGARPLKHVLTGGIVGSSGAVSVAIGAPWWAMLLAMIFAAVVLLVTLRMTVDAIYRLATLAHTGSVKGPWGIEWKASTEPATPEPEQPEPPKPKL